VVLKQSESAVEYFHMTMENVLVTKRLVSGDRTTGDRLCLSFTKAKVDYRPRNADGGFGPLVRASL
jgi:type VI protein secretion system component Hcp